MKPIAPVTEVAAPTASAVPAITSDAQPAEIDAQALRLRLAQRQRIQRAAGGGQQRAADHDERQDQPDLASSFCRPANPAASS